MKKWFFIPVFICCLLLVQGCHLSRQPKGDELAGLWELSARQETASDDLLGASFLNLRKDGSYTMYLPDYFDYGDWQYIDGRNAIKLVSTRIQTVYKRKWDLHIQSGSNKELLVSFPDGDQLALKNIDSADERERIRMIIPEPLVLTRSEVSFPEDADPFSLKYNQWRIPAGQKEACEELRARVVNHLQHLQLLFDGFSHSGSETVSYAHSPTMFRMAANGIALEPFDEIPNAYIHTFYDKEDAIMAYYLTEGFFGLDLVFPEKHEKHSELWAFLLKQMIDKGREADLCGMVDKRVQRYRQDSTARAQQADSDN